MPLFQWDRPIAYPISALSFVESKLLNPIVPTLSPILSGTIAQRRLSLKRNPIAWYSRPLITSSMDSAIGSPASSAASGSVRRSNHAGRSISVSSRRVIPSLWRTGNTAGNKL